MKLSEVKTYVLGVLRGAFKNKDIIDKLSINERKDLTYNGLPVNGKYNCYRQEEVIWEGQIYKTNETAVLSKSIYDYDELIFCCRMQQNYHQWENFSFYPKDLTFNLTNDIMLAGYSTCWQDGMFTDEYTYKVTGYNTANNLQVYLKKIIGIKYTAMPDTIKAVEYYDNKEHIIGSWTNGKPMYRKIIRAYITGSGSREYYLPDKFENAEEYVIESFYAFGSSSYKGSGMVISSSNSSTGRYDMSFTSFTPATGRLWLINGADTNRYIQLVLRYTKTTDLPNSFSPDLIHNPLTRYSTEETRIGEWIDGKPLYRKVLEINLSVKVATWYNVCPRMTEIDTLTQAIALADGRVISCEVDNGNGSYFQVEIPNGYGNRTLNKMILEYTKKED